MMVWQGWTAAERRAVRPARSHGMIELLRHVRRGSAVAFVLASGACIVLVGLLLMWFSGGGAKWGYWFGVGIALYGAALALHGSSFVLRLFREASDGGLAAQRGVGPEREC